MTFLKPFEELLKYNEPIGIKSTEKFDAALVFYLMAKTIDKNQRYDIELYPYNATWRKSEAHIYDAAKKIHTFIKETFPKVKIHDLEYFEYSENHFSFLINYANLSFPYGRNRWLFWDFARKEMNKKYGINICLDGRARNFPLDVLIKNGYSGRHLEKDFDFSKEIQNYTPYDSPFNNINRKEVAKIYKDLDLMHTLLPITRVCMKEIPCEICNWCKEFKVAFGATFSEYIQNVPEQNRIHIEYVDRSLQSPDVLNPHTLLD